MKRFLSMIAAGVVVLTFAANPALGAGAEKVDLLRNASGLCSSGATGGTVNRSFAIINYPGNDTVSAQVVVKGGPPNATLNVSIVQTPSGENCFGAEATLTTNADGNGTAHLSEPLLPGQTGAFVIINGGLYATQGVPNS